jgi:hypothetical protein
MCLLCIVKLEGNYDHKQVPDQVEVYDGTDVYLNEMNCSKQAKIDNMTKALAAFGTPRVLADILLIRAAYRQSHEGHLNGCNTA